jgi:hypothetical protein
MEYPKTVIFDCGNPGAFTADCSDGIFLAE